MGVVGNILGRNLGSAWLFNKLRRVEAQEKRQNKRWASEHGVYISDFLKGWADVDDDIERRRHPPIHFHAR
jgi:hypothetical protein